MPCMSLDTDPMTAQHLLMPKTIAIRSLSGPAPEQVTIPTSSFPGKGILKDTIILKVDGAVRVITMQIITPASMIMETQAAGIVTMGLASGTLAPGTGDTGMTLNMTHTGRKAMLTVTGLRNVMITGGTTLASREALMMTLSSPETPMEKKWTGAVSTANTQHGACAALTACPAAEAASAPTHTRVRFTEATM